MGSNLEVKWVGHLGVKKISLHFWMIQTMFKNKKK